MILFWIVVCGAPNKFFSEKLPRQPLFGTLVLCRAAQGQDSNIRQVSITFGIVQAVSNDKFVGDREANIVRAHGGEATLRLVQQNRDSQVPGFALLKKAQKVLKRH